MERWLRRYWGYPVFVLLILTWMAFVGGNIPDRTALAFLTLLSLVDAYYFAFRVPLFCGAENRKEGTYCRNNSYGILQGCHLREHKWQRVKMLVVKERWREVYHQLFRTPRQGLATVVSIATLVSTAVSVAEQVVSLFLKK
jgi:hypothetical protein